MLRNYLTTAWRSLAKRPAFSAINVAGLTLGLAVCFLTLLLPLRQWRTDRFHENADRVHRVVTHTPPDFGLSASDGFATSPAPLAPLAERLVPGIAAALRMRETSADLRRGGETVALGAGVDVGAGGLFAEPSFFEVFDAFALARGDGRAALRQPFSVVLTREAARRLFGEADPVGQTVRLAGTGTFTVTGVLAEPDGRSHLDFDALFSFSTLRSEGDRSLSDWSSVISYHTYFLLEKGADPQAVQAGLHEAGMRLESPQADFNAQEDITENPFALEALTEIAFNPTRGNEIARPMLPVNVLLALGALAGVVVLAAGANYANLSVARSLSRAREVGVRRTVGATRGQVAGQFLGEAVLVALLALAMAWMLLQALLPAFNNLYLVQLGELEFSDAILRNGGVLGAFAVFSVAVGLLAGAYPALVLSRFRPAEVLGSGSGRGGTGGRSQSRLRSVLTGGQFALSLVFMVTGVVAFQQARHADEGDYGFATEDVVTVDLGDVDFETFRNEARSVAGVEQVLGSSLTPAAGSRQSRLVRVAGGEHEASIVQYDVEHAFLDAMDLSFEDGRAPTEAQFGGGRGVVVNAAAARALELEAEARGQRVVIDSTGYRVAGLVEGFQFSGMGSGDEPVLLRSGGPADFGHALVHVTPGSAGRVAKTLAALGPALGNAEDLAAQPYDELLYERHALLYDEGARFVSVAALLAVVISCLGLLGMAAYAVEARRREIAVRMAVGASAWDVALLLSKRFLALVGVAVAAGLPVAWLLNRLWLEQLATRVAVGLPTLAGCAALLTALALAAVGSQAWRATRTNPAQALRDE